MIAFFGAFAFRWEKYTRFLCGGLGSGVLANDEWEVK